MAQDLSELIFNVRVILKESVEGFWTDEYLTVEINHAEVDLALRLPSDCLPKLQVTKKHNIIVGQSEYSIRPSAGIESTVFVGVGAVNVATSGGAYTGTADADYRVKISATGTPDKFKYSANGGVTWSAEANIVAGPIALNNGVTITFGATTGHTLNDVWGFWARVAPTEMLRVAVVKLNGIVCRHIFTPDIKEIENNSYITADAPVCWLWSEKVSVFPAPTSVALNGVEIMNIREPVALAAGEDIPEITSPHHELIEGRVAGKAFIIHQDGQGADLLKQYEDGINGRIAKYSGVNKIDYPLPPPPEGG